MYQAKRKPGASLLRARPFGVVGPASVTDCRSSRSRWRANPDRVHRATSTRLLRRIAGRLAARARASRSPATQDSIRLRAVSATARRCRESGADGRGVPVTRINRSPAPIRPANVLPSSARGVYWQRRRESGMREDRSQSSCCSPSEHDQCRASGDRGLEAWWRSPDIAEARP